MTGFKSLTGFIAHLLLLLCLLSGCAGPPTEPTPTLDPLLAQGRAAFNQHCASCHALTPDTVVVGPSLAGIADRAGSQVPGLDARQYIELSVLKPGLYIVEGFADAMPADLGKKLTGEELNALAAFLLSLE